MNLWPFSSALDRELATARKRVELAELNARLAPPENAVAAPVNAATATYPLSDPLAYEKLFGIDHSAVTPQKAMTNAAFYRCVFLIAGCVSMLQLDSLRGVGTPDEVAETDSPQALLLGERPNPRYSRTAFWRSIVADMLLNGNGLAWIERLGSGQPKALWWIPWGRSGIHFWTPPNGETELLYHLTLDDGRLVTAPQDDVMHFGGSPQWNLFYYLSPLAAYASSVGIGNSASNYAKAYFDNGFSADSVVSYPTPKTPDQAREIRAKLYSQLGGDNRFTGPVVLDGGASFQQLRINANDAQLLQTREFSMQEIGMIMGVPGHLLNMVTKSTGFGKGLEELTQGWLDFGLGPHLAAIEEEINYKLYGNRVRAARFNRDSFIRGDLKSRAEAMQVLLGGAQGPGVISRNEARVKIGMPKKRGDEHDKVLDWGAPVDGGAAPPPSPAQTPAEPSPAKTGKPKRA